MTGFHGREPRDGYAEGPGIGHSFQTTGQGYPVAVPVIGFQLAIANKSSAVGGAFERSGYVRSAKPNKTAGVFGAFDVPTLVSGAANGFEHVVVTVPAGGMNKESFDNSRVIPGIYVKQQRSELGRDRAHTAILIQILCPAALSLDSFATHAIQDSPRISLFRQRLERLHNRVDKALDRAEDAVRVATDKEGRLVAVGSDLSPLASLLSQAHKNLEILGRATGELEPQMSQGISIQIVCPAAPSPDNMPRISYASADEIGEVEAEIGVRQLR
jgi:hypothetical protein